MNKHPFILANKSESYFFTNYSISLCLVFLPLDKIKTSNHRIIPIS